MGLNNAAKRLKQTSVSRRGSIESTDSNALKRMKLKSTNRSIELRGARKTQTIKKIIKKPKPNQEELGKVDLATLQKSSHSSRNEGVGTANDSGELVNYETRQAAIKKPEDTS